MLKSRWPLALIGLTAVLYGLCHAGGFFMNLSDSMPKGLYRKVDRLPAVGQLATSCLTPEIAAHGLARGYLVPGICPTAIQPVMKAIMAVSGDTVAIADGHLQINGVAHPELIIATQDSKDRALTLFYHTPYRIPPGHVLLISDYISTSWDGRFWGAVPIRELVEPVLVVRHRLIE